MRGHRLIPAHAGKTRRLSRWAARIWAHPRSRGENARDQTHEISHEGSSPLTRGKPVRRCGTGEYVRLIPAHAGKTAALERPARGDRAHPRSRGENVLAGLQQASGGGSSPLTRGKRYHAHGSSDGARLIPAHAGKTQRGVEVFQRTTAHPRSRGENYSPVLMIWIIGGSSPLTRGKPALVALGDVAPGLIPAHAGKTPRD